MSESARSDFHFDLTDRVVLVTGAARGLGACIAKRAAAGGARLLLGDIRDAQGEAVAKKTRWGINAGHPGNNRDAQRGHTTFVPGTYEAKH